MSERETAWLKKIADRNAELPPHIRMLDDAQGILLELETTFAFGLIPFFENLQSKHPEFEEEIVFTILEDLRAKRDEISPLETEMRQFLNDFYPDSTP